MERRCLDWANATGNRGCNGKNTSCVNVCLGQGTVDVGSELCAPMAPMVSVCLLSLLWMSIAICDGCAETGEGEDRSLEDTALLPPAA
jgi:hypothetical protein